MRRLCTRFHAAFLVGLLGMAAIGLAQTDTGSIGGYVKDPSGQSVPKATVTVKNEGTNEVRTLTTNDSGYYVQPNLQPGIYAVAVEATGFKRFESRGNKLNSNTSLSLDANLTVGNITETVEVSATAEVLRDGIVGRADASQRQAGRHAGIERPQSAVHRTTSAGLA